MAHVLVACEIRADESARRKELRKALRDQLDGYSWVGAIRDVYVVQLQSIDDRGALKSRLLDLAKGESGVRFIMTPVMDEGTYGGWLRKEHWPKIRGLTPQVPSQERGERDSQAGDREEDGGATEITGAGSKNTLLAVVSLGALLGAIALRTTLKKREQSKKSRIRFRRPW